MFGRSITAVLTLALLINGGEAKQPIRRPSTHSSHHTRGSKPIDTSNYRFLTNKTKCLLYSIPFVQSFNLDWPKCNIFTAHVVESLPDVHFELGEMYSGFMPIRENDSLFYIFQPKIGEPSDDLTVWLNGGPGCSSMQGFLQENGRFTWQPGTYEPVINEYSWVNLTNMLW